VQKCVTRGYTPMTTPDLVRASVLEKCGFQPRMANTQTYSVEGSDLCLAGTAEVPLGGVYMDKVVEEMDLPIRMAACGHCFRTEAGAAGMAGKGLYRVHQFSKVEMFVLSTPAQSEALLEELTQIEVRPRRRACW
jgi:seryl-tRNA synthetase